MLTTEQFREYILPYLYDLLDTAERVQFEAYLVESPEAAELLNRARDQQLLLAVAARESFPDVRFAPGSALSTGIRVAPQTTLAAKPVQRARPKVFAARWAIAASIAVLILTGGYLGLRGWNDHKGDLAQANDQFTKANQVMLDLQQKTQREQSQAQKDIRDIQDQIDRLVGDWNQEVDTTKRVLKDKQVQVIITGPRNLQAGAKNQYQIQVKSPKKEVAPKFKPAIIARVVNQGTGAVVLEKNVDSDVGTIDIDLPRELPIRANSNFALEVRTTADDGAPVEVREHLKLVAPEYLTHLATDRPMYRPGETVRFRSLTLERFSLRPPQDDLKLRFTVTGPNNSQLFKLDGFSQIVTDGKKTTVTGPDGEPLKGIGVGEYALPPDLAGGQYTLTVSETEQRFPDEKRTFLVNRWQAPLFNKDLHFHRSSYGPGDVVQIHGKAVRVDGNQAQLGVELTASVDGQMIKSLFKQAEFDGAYHFEFQLPAAMEAGDGTVALKFQDGGNVETLVRPIPILLDKILVEFYPEGGDLVAGLPNRVYFQARTPTGKPADLKGNIVDEGGTIVARAETVTDDKEPGLNQGFGSFEFTPRESQVYRLKIDSPIGIKGNFALPASKPDGVVLRLSNPVVDSAIDLTVTSAQKDRSLLVGAYCRGRLIDFTQAEVQAGQAKDLTLRPALGVGGVYRVTVFEKLSGGGFQPIAERLIFRRSPEKLDLTVAAAKPVYHPGERVQLTLGAKNEKKEWSAAVLMVSVVDLSVSKLANDKTARAMPTHFLLTSEVRRPEDLENADFFVGSHPRAERGLDLLLGVQGWRRFAEQDPTRFAKEHQKDEIRFMQSASPGGVQTTNPEKEDIAKVDNRFAPKFVELQQHLGSNEKVILSIPEKQQKVQQAQNALPAAQANIGVAGERLAVYERSLLRACLAFLVIALLGAGLLAIFLGMKRLSAGRPAARHLTVGGIVLGLLFLSSMVGTFYLMGSRHREIEFGRDMAAAEMKQRNNMGQAMPGVAVAPPQGIGPDFNPANPVMVGIAQPHLPPQFMAPMAHKMAPPINGNLAMADAHGGFGLPMEIAPPVAPGIMKGAMNRFANEHKLRLEGNIQDILKGRLGRQVPLPENINPFIVREYAHKHTASKEGSRVDFTETVLWRPAVVLKDGKGQVSFELSDSTTQYQVLVAGHTLDGRLGAATLEIAATLPFTVDPRVPVEITSTDTVIIPVAVTNNSDAPSTVNLTVQSQGMAQQNGEAPRSFVLKPGSKGRRLLTFVPNPGAVDASLSIQGRFTPAGFDSVTRSFKVVPDGFPIALSLSGLLEDNAQHAFVLPQTWVPGTMQCQVQVFPSTLAELQKGLEGLLREPCGCFEQSSTSNYPNVLILNYLKESSQANSDVEKRARLLLEKGYQQLTSFECADPRERQKRQGYEWFGQTAPPHEALTAYGLLQFKDMAKVFPVDKDMLERTRAYLLDARDGAGGFKRNPRSVDSFGRAPDQITNAYILWALTESGESANLDKELAATLDKAKSSTDPYLVSLAGLAHLNSGKTKEALELLKGMRDRQKSDGRLAGATASITGSGGRDLEIESTGLGVLAWLRANRPADFRENIDLGVKWLGQQRGGNGGFGATQSTILALKALIAFTQENKKAVQPGQLKLIVNNEEVASQSFSGNLADPLTLALPPEIAMRPGENKVRVEVTGKNTFPYTFTVSYRTLKPANSAACPVHLQTSLSNAELTEGESVRLTATVLNKTGKGQGMTVAIVGLPAGLALPEDMAQLKELAALREENGKTKSGVISAWELKGRELILYWRDLAPDAKIDVNLDLVARLPGTYRGPASRAYPYYNADNKFWVQPLEANITGQE